MSGIGATLRIVESLQADGVRYDLGALESQSALKARMTLQMNGGRRSPRRRLLGPARADQARTGPASSHSSIDLAFGLALPMSGRRAAGARSGAVRPV